MSLTPRRLLAALVAAAAAFLITPALASAATVAVFDDPAYVDTAGGSGAESDNIQASITAKGHTVRAFTGITAANFSFALAGAKVLVIPDQEINELAPDLSGDAVHIIRSYVASGGGLILSDNTGTNVATLLDRVFGIAVTQGSGPGTTTKQAAAAGTNFAAGPGSLLKTTGPISSPGFRREPPRSTRTAPTRPWLRSPSGTGRSSSSVGTGSTPTRRMPGNRTAAGRPVLGRALTEVAGTGCNITGSPGVDTINGTSRGDRICAWGGNDLISAAGGNDVVIAGPGGDTVNGGNGKDRLIGGTGADTLNGKAGKDFLDTRDGAHGNDHANGGPGADTCRRDSGDHISSC